MATALQRSRGVLRDDAARVGALDRARDPAQPTIRPALRRFGDAAYAFEELVAELGSAFVLGHCGLVDATIEGHAAYLDSWLQVLKNDRTAIFTAARHAGAAFEFILSKEMPRGDRAPQLPSGA